MGVRTWITSWPVYRQLTGADPLVTGGQRVRTVLYRAPYATDRLRRTMGIASLGGATLDNEENYLIKKLFTALGAIQIENPRYVVAPQRERLRAADGS